jgi:hypothetical protein
MQMYPARVTALLYELCVDLGFCLPAKGQHHLECDPPTDIDEFTDAVFQEEGMDPSSSSNRNLRKTVRERVARHFEEFRRNIAEQANQ